MPRDALGCLDRAGVPCWELIRASCAPSGLSLPTNPCASSVILRRAHVSTAVRIGETGVAYGSLPVPALI